MKAIKAIEVQNLEFKYPEGFSINDISFSINKGEIVGLLGHNGAGKTTIIKCLVGLLDPSEKTNIYISNSEKENIKHSSLGYVPQSPLLYDLLTVKEFIILMGRLNGMKTTEAVKLAAPLLCKMDLSHKTNELIKNLSGGMKQKVSTIGALLSSPTVLILDEPMTAFDAKSTMKMKEFLTELVSNSQIGVLLSSHRLDIVESLCRKVIIIEDGRIIFSGKIAELKKNTTLEKAFIKMTTDYAK